jgi:hypothetical protein
VLLLVLLLSLNIPLMYGRGAYLIHLIFVCILERTPVYVLYVMYRILRVLYCVFYVVWYVVCNVCFMCFVFMYFMLNVFCAVSIVCCLYFMYCIL